VNPSFGKGGLGHFFFSFFPACFVPGMREYGLFKCSFSPRGVPSINPGRPLLFVFRDPAKDLSRLLFVTHSPHEASLLVGIVGFVKTRTPRCTLPGHKLFVRKVI